MTNDVFSFKPATFDKYFIGADKMLQALTKSYDYIEKNPWMNYPPYNIVKNDDNNYVIEIAVAGFGKNNIEIEMANNVLTVKGSFEADEDRSGPQYIFKGIADRSFTRQFRLSDTVEVKNAELINGMLKLWLENIIPEHQKPKKIDIKGD